MTPRQQRICESLKRGAAACKEPTTLYCLAADLVAMLEVAGPQPGITVTDDEETRNSFVRVLSDDLLHLTEAACKDGVETDA